jgi:KaiC/GvpD/RAD55 family RecA-like ATPase
MAITDLQARIDATVVNGSDHPPPWEIPPAESYADEPGAQSAKANGSAQADEAIEPFPFASLDEISDEVRPQIVQNVLESASVAVVAGAPNTGKTFFAVHACVHVAAGEPWFGCKVAGGAVIYVAAEAPGSVKTRARLAADRAFSGKYLPFHVVSNAPGLGSEIDSVHDTKRLLATIHAVASREGLDVKLIAIDTVASVLGDGEENADGMLRLAGSAKFIASQTNATVLLIHHPSKGDPNSLRGHSSLAAAVDTIISIVTDENTGVRTATLTKSRDSAAGRQFFFNLEAVKLPTPDYFGDPRTSCIVIPINVPISQRRRPGGKAQEQLLAELERRYRTGETHMDEAAIRKAGHGLGMHRNSIPKALKGLRVSGFVVGEAAQITLKYPPETT